MGTSSYLIALGGNVHTQRGTPKTLLTVLVAAAEAGADLDISALRPPATPAFTGVTQVRASLISTTSAIGPSRRAYANAAILVETDLDPPALLAHLKSIERAHGRRPGRRWGSRPLDLDIIGWSGGIWTSPGLVIPHPAFRRRRFVLAPLVEIVPGWRDPVTNLTARQLLARLDRRRPRP